MSDRVAALEAELEMERAADAFVAAKKALWEKDTPQRRSAYREAKETLRGLRQSWRVEHRQAPSGPGDAAASPDTIESKVN